MFSLPFSMLIGLALAGCLVSTKPVRTEVGRKPLSGSPRVIDKSIEVWAYANGSTAQLNAAWRRSCVTPQSAEVTYREEKKSTFLYPSCASSDTACHFRQVLAIFVAPITIPVSGLATLVVLIADEPVSYTDLEEEPPREHSCDIAAADLPLRLTIDGAVHRVVTNRGGKAFVELERRITVAAWRSGWVALETPDGRDGRRFPLARHQTR